MTVFKNRREAGQLLADHLAEFHRAQSLVLGIPRGGVVVAAEIAKTLGGELDVVLVHKLGAPGDPEVAVGAVDEYGNRYLSEYASRADIGADYINQECERQVASLRERRRLYTPVRPPVSVEGRTVIVVDDGLATGATMYCALAALRKQNPERLLAAVAVAPREAIGTINRVADRTVCLASPDRFFAVSECFDDFTQVSDDEVVEALRRGVASPATDEPARGTTHPGSEDA